MRARRLRSLLLILAGLAAVALFFPETGDGQGDLLDRAERWLTDIALADGPDSANEHSLAQERTSAGSKLPLASGNFDFWVLSLSWSPSFCMAEGDDADSRQCGRRGPEGFVVHGLWPQFDGGGYPYDCPTSLPRRISRQTYSEIDDLIPSIGLAGHQWRKHGSCTGLSHDQYFAVTRAAYDAIRIPASFGGSTISPAEAEKAFIRLNEDLQPESVAVTCDRQFLREVRICLDKDLHFRECPAVDRRACNRENVEIPR